MKISEIKRARLFDEGLKIIGQAPDIEMELRLSLGLVQNEMDVNVPQVKKSLSRIVDAILLKSSLISSDTESKLVDLFNHISEAYDAPYRLGHDNGVIYGKVLNEVYDIERFRKYFG